MQLSTLGKFYFTLLKPKHTREHSCDDSYLFKAWSIRSLLIELIRNNGDRSKESVSSLIHKNFTKCCNSIVLESIKGTFTIIYESIQISTSTFSLMYCLHFSETFLSAINGTSGNYLKRAQNTNTTV